MSAAGSGARVIDLAGRTVLPGFIEPHMHFALLAAFGQGDERLGVAPRAISDIKISQTWMDGRQVYEG